ncbi:MAG: MFS transporter [Actinomycetota bacterium]|nr:MFS transporter [Actinomycetota bacterium]
MHYGHRLGELGPGLHHGEPPVGDPPGTAQGNLRPRSEPDRDRTLHGERRKAHARDLLVLALEGDALLGPELAHQRQQFDDPRPATAASVVTFCLGAALFGAMILMPLYFQVVRGEGALQTGLLLIPQGVGGGIGMALSGRLTERLGAGRTSLMGGVILVLATFPFLLIGAGTPFAVIGAAMLVRGIGIGLSMMPAMTAAFSVLSREQVNDASPQLTVLQRVGGSLGTAIIAVVLQGHLNHAAHTHPALAASFAHTYWWVMGVTLIAAAQPYADADRASQAQGHRREFGPRRRPCVGGSVSVKAKKDAEHRPATENLRQAAVQMFGAERRLRSRDHSRAGELTHAQLRALATIGREQAMTAGQLAKSADLNPGDRHRHARPARGPQRRGATSQHRGSPGVQRVPDSRGVAAPRAQARLLGFAVERAFLGVLGPGPRGRGRGYPGGCGAV